jgi:hypothetical protein
MPGAGIGQAGVAMGSDILGQLLGNLYGAGKSIAQGQYGTNAGINNAFNTAQQFANQIHYTPPTQAGRDIYEGVNKLPQVLTGSHMGIGPLPELMGMNARFTPDDLRVAGRTATQDIRNFSIDYANAKAGIQREYPTAGSRAAQFTDVAGDLAKPLAEKAYDMYMNPESSVEVYGMRPSANLSGLATAGGPMYAVKPGGGNYPTTLGSTKPLSEQRNLGRHLAEIQISDPIETFIQQFKNHYPNATDNRQLLREWEDFLDEYALSKDPDYHNYISKNHPAVKQLTKEAADAFAENYNIGASLAPEGESKKLYTPSQIEEIAPHWNTWVMSPYQKYITNQMGTGLPTDPVLKKFDEANVPISNFINESGREIKGFLPEVKPLSAIGENYLSGKRGTASRNYMLSGADMDAPQNINIGKETAITPSGKRMEAAIDTSFDLSGFYDPKNYPQLNKLDKRAVINDIDYSGPEEGTGLPAIRKKVLEDMLQGKLLPKDIPKTLPANVLQKLIDEYKDIQKSTEAIEQAKDDWRKARYESIESDIPYEDGSKMHIITQKDVQNNKNLVFRDLGQSTIDLNQCVGAGCHHTPDYPSHGPYIEPHTGKSPKQVQPYEKTHVKRYMDRLEKGESEIGRLLDKNGVAQATVELINEKPKTLTNSDKERIIGFYLEDNKPPEYVQQFYQDMSKFGKSKAIDNALVAHPELNDILKERAVSGKKYINEMKGNNNQEVKPEYVPHMVAWLNQHARELNRVGDLKNLPKVYDANESFDVVGKLSDEKIEWNLPNIQEVFNKAVDENLLPRFFTTDQFDKLATDLGIDLSAELSKTEPKFNRLTDLQKDVISANVYDYLNNPDLIDMENLAEPYKTDIKILAGNQNERAKLPTDMHQDLIYILLNQDENERSIRRMLDALENPGYFIHMPELNTPQLENILGMLTSWTERYPLAE